MYEAYYGLRERPFDLTPNPRFLFMTPGHREALNTIQYGIAGRKGITLLVGPAGTGKTTLVHAALERQAGGCDSKALFLTNPTLTREEFLEFLALEFGLSEKAGHSKIHLLRELQETLVQRHAAGMATALIVDEAQAMPDHLLEEVRLLANMETTTDKLLPVVLVGQLELAVRLKDERLQQLRQRVALRATLAALTRQETATYVAERIRIAGGDVRNVFATDAIATIYQCSGGIPRIISVLCDNALVSGFALDQRPIRRAVVDEVRRDFDLDLARDVEDRDATASAPDQAHIAASVDSDPAHDPDALFAPPALLVVKSAAPAPPMLSVPVDEEPRSEEIDPPRRGLRAVFGRMISR